MNDQDRREFYRSWAAAWELHARPVSETMLRFAFESLQQFDLPDVQRAILLHSQDPDGGQFPPKPADIVRQIEGGGDERSLKAFTKVEQAVTQIGSWKRIVFDDARIHRVIEDMGGYMTFCSADYEGWPFLRNEFCKRYRAYMQHAPKTYPAIISGEGGHSEPPVLVGDSKLAVAVMLHGQEAQRSIPISHLDPLMLTHTGGDTT